MGGIPYFKKIRVPNHWWIINNNGVRVPEPMENTGEKVTLQKTTNIYNTLIFKCGFLL